MKKLLSTVLLSGLMLFAVPALAECPVNVNTADATMIAECLKGVGQKTADKIVAYREENGAFASPEDLKQVKGIGDKIIENNKDNILFE